MKRLLILMGIIVFPAVTGFQTVPRDANARIKAVFIYNFTRYIEWPDDYKSGDFVVDLYGNNPDMLTELNNMARVKTVGTQKIDVKNTTSLSGIGKCHILYVTSDVTTPLTEIAAKLKGKSTLIITEKPGSAKQGSAINFVVIDNRQKFELNESNAEKYKLKVSSSLVALAIPVQ